MMPTSSRPLSPHTALQRAWGTEAHRARPVAARPRLLIAGATGVIGNAVLRALVGGCAFAHTDVLAREPTATGMATVSMRLVGDAPIESWPPHAAAFDTAIVMFEPPRPYSVLHGREQSIFTPQPADLPALAQWLRRCGVSTLVVIVPHDTGRLPDALKRGLVNLDEQAVAALGFERLLFVRSARKAATAPATSIFEKTAAWMLSTLGYMIPAGDQPVRPAKLAAFVDAALRVLPVGTHVASPELLAQANHSRPQRYGLMFPRPPRATGIAVSGAPGNRSPGVAGDADSGDMQAVVRRWLDSAHNHPPLRTATASTPATSTASAPPEPPR